jgi:hypothetical protein
MRSFCLLALFGLVVYAPCQASTIVLNTGLGNAITYRPADSGPGQAVFASDAVTITGMALQLAMPNGGDIKYMIWNSTNSVLLFSEEQTVTASTTPTFVQSDPFSFDLIAGSTYYFGVIGDNNLNVEYITPSVPVTQNGLTVLLTGNSNYVNFSTPTVARPGFVEMALQLSGGSESQVPEPAGWLMVLSGAILVALLRVFVVRRRSPETGR